MLLRIIGLHGDYRGSFTTAVGLLQDQKFHRDINGGYCAYGGPVAECARAGAPRAGGQYHVAGLNLPLPRIV